jgi:hypothetical protein
MASVEMHDQHVPKDSVKHVRREHTRVQRQGVLEGLVAWEDALLKDLPKV